MNSGMWRATAVAAFVTGFGFSAAPALAQATSGGATRTFVSGTTAGNDGNMCTRTSPCATFAGALAKTAIGGEVNCLDAGGFGTATITNSVSIVCENTEAGVMANTSGASGIVINGAAGAVVTLIGLDIDGYAGAGTDGVQFNSGASLVLDNVRIRNFSGFGVRFVPTAAATLTVKRAAFRGNGSASTTTSGGMLISPTGATAASVTIIDAHFANNLNYGLRVDSGNGATISATVVDTVVSNTTGTAGTGLLFRVPSGSINGTLTGVTSTNNTRYGLIGNGPAMLGVTDMTITGNGNGVLGQNGAMVTTFGDNKLFGNTANGSFTASTTAQ